MAVHLKKDENNCPQDITWRNFSDVNNFGLISTTLKIMQDEFHCGCLHASRPLQYSMISHHRFTKGKSCQTNLITVFNKTVSSADTGRVLAVICLGFSEAFVTTFHSHLLDKLARYRLDGWSVR